MRRRVLKRALVVLACAAVTTPLAACQSTERESAQIELQSRAAQAAELAKERAAKARSHGHAGAHNGGSAHKSSRAHSGGASG